MNKKVVQPENIGDVFTKDGLKAISVGQTLLFNKDGKELSFKVVRRHVKRHELWVRPIHLYHPDEVAIVDKV